MLPIQAASLFIVGRTPTEVCMWNVSVSILFGLLLTLSMSCGRRETSEVRQVCFLFEPCLAEIESLSFSIIKYIFSLQLYTLSTDMLSFFTGRVFRILQGLHQRHVAATQMNELSSRQDELSKGRSALFYPRPLGP